MLGNTNGTSRTACHPAGDNELVAIVGVGCRFPGDANDAASFWKLLLDGVDALTEIPTDRWDLRTYYDAEGGKSGKTNVRYGGFIRDIDRFDAGFFGISPREAARMDPQQRILLETAWEALEDGGQVLEKIGGLPVSVFVGIASYDYSLIQAGYRDRHSIDVYTNTGGALSIAANRISYCLNFKGPSAAVDTACSSALSAVHLACHTLWHEGSPLALAGGLNIIITPGPYLGFSKLNMLSSDGRCKAFDARGNGFVRAEGCGFVVLKRLSDALADGDRIYALIRSTVANQDGRTSGLTVPSQSSQEELVRAALRAGRVEPRQVQFVEAHGTGTLVGDPIEARALGNVLSVGRPEGERCLIGSVKTNIGHLEAGAGVAGLIKTALALKNKLIPKNLHYQEPNPDIDFTSLKLCVPTEHEPWPAHEGPAMAGVNSFGFGGSNSHVLLQEAPEQPIVVETGPALPEGHACLVPLSARSPEALKALAKKYQDFLQANPRLSLRDLCHSLRFRRTHHDHRLCVATHSVEELANQLGAFASGEAVAAAVTDRALVAQKNLLAFVFAGQGPQWWAMGRQLLEKEPVFRDVIERADAIIRPLGGWSLLAEMTADEEHSRIPETAFAQPAIFAVQAGLFHLWQSWGVTPDAIIGHSVGEVATAYAAGVLDFEDAVRVIFHRGRCMELASERGKMLAAAIPADEARRIADGSDGRIFVAAINSPNSVTLSGDGAALEALERDLQQRQVYVKFLQVQYAFHSAHMDPAREELLRALADVRPRAAAIPLVSTVSGEWTDGTEMGADYWWRNVRQSVLFADGVDRLLEKEHNVFLELSPHPVLGSSVAECAQVRGKKVKNLASLRRKEEEQVTALRTLGALHAMGLLIDWEALPPSGGRYTPLPLYAWQREHYWHEAEESKFARLGLRGTHPLLGMATQQPVPAWMSNLDANWLPYLNDHKVQGAVLVPAAAYVEMALAAGKETYAGGPYVLEDVRFIKACFLPKGQARTSQTVYHPHDSTFQIHTQRQEAGQAWVLHAGGTVRSRHEDPLPSPDTLDVVRARCGLEIAGADCYSALKKIGLEYGPTFQGVQTLWVGKDEAVGAIAAPAGVAEQLNDYHFHPAMLDACLQVILGALSSVQRNRDSARGVYLPVEIEELRVYARPGAKLWAHARLVEFNRQGLTAALRIMDEQGALLAEVRNLRCQFLGVDGGEADTLDDLLYEFEWRLQPRPDQATVRKLSHVTPLTEVAAVVEAEAERIASQLQWERYAGLELVLDHLCTAYVWEALQKLGADLTPGMRFATDELADRLNVAAQHRRLFGRYLAALAEDGILRRLPGTEWEVARPFAHGDSLATWRKLLTENPAFFAELTLIGRCGRNLADVLTGTTNPLQLIFPEGNLSTAEHLYQDSPSVRFYNTLAQHAIARALESLPADRTLRVLEVGAGTGGLTSYVLPRLPQGRTEYCFTDLSNHFFIKAGQKFADYPFIRYQKLDLEKDPIEQGFAEHTFDVVLASQVLHATKDLRQTLGNVRKLLGRGGLLVLLEVVKPARWIDMVFGLTDGWWRFTDTDLRTEYPLLTFPKWKALLGEMGFTETVDVSRTRQVEGFGSAVILSRAPDAAAIETNGHSDAPVIVNGHSNGEAPVALNGHASTNGTHPATETSNWLVFADEGGVGDRLASVLRKRGGVCTVVRKADTFGRRGDDLYNVDPARVEDMKQLLEALRQGGALPLRGVVHLWNLDAPAADGLTPEQIDGAHDLGCLSVVNLAQAWNDLPDSSRLWVVTAGGQSVGVEPSGVAMGQTLSWGLNRVLFNEFPKLRCQTLDLSAVPTDEEVRSLADELFAADEEDEVALRGDARYVHRYARTTVEKRKRAVGIDRPYRLEVPRFGVLDKLTFREFEPEVPGRNQLTIKVHAAALNFSDVMKALGLYPGLPDGPIPMGIECAGVVTAVGEGVEEFKLGDAVVAMAPFSLGTHVTTYYPLVAHKPKRLTFDEAATLPIAFLTADYALNHLGHMTEGERVLIHAASGGVGLAAIQLARNAGAEVFATAGSTDKREFIASLGVEHVLNSRTLAFADEVMARTGGKGVDLVLNSLSGEAIGKGLECLAEYGRFLEIGKRDIYMNSRLGMRPFRKNTSFIAIDLDRAMRQRPAVLATLFRNLVKQVDEGKLHALPHRVFTAGNLVSAFRHMAQAKHIGKVIVSMEDRAVSVVPAPLPPMTFKADATYLMTGGLGGFGLTVARWMVENGARNLVLMGRRGIHSPEAAASVEALERLGARVHVAAADVSDAGQVAGVLAHVKETMPPLRGVMHAAMVLDDCLLTKLDRDALLRVIRPKATGGWNLHTQTLGMPLDFFVCFSSMASVFGLPGQANYAAGNTFLDELAAHRRSLGLPCLTVNWGYLSEVGYVARNEKVGERFEGQGLKSFSPTEALALVGRLLQQDRGQVGVMRMDWARWGGLGLSRAGLSPRFKDLSKTSEGKDGQGTDGLSIRKQLLGAAPDQRKDILLEFLKDKVARVLGSSPDKIDLAKPLTDVGLDSLMAVELRNWVEGELRVTIPIVELMQGPSVDRLADLLLEQLLKSDAPPAPAVAPPVEAPAAQPEPVAVGAAPEAPDAARAAELLTRVDALSDAEVDALLGTMTAEKEQPR